MHTAPCFIKSFVFVFLKDICSCCYINMLAWKRRLGLWLDMWLRLSVCYIWKYFTTGLSNLYLQCVRVVILIRLSFIIFFLRVGGLVVPRLTAQYSFTWSAWVQTRPAPHFGGVIVQWMGWCPRTQSASVRTPLYAPRLTAQSVSVSHPPLSRKSERPPSKGSA